MRDRGRAVRNRISRYEDSDGVHDPQIGDPRDGLKRLWLIDGAYLFSTQGSIRHGYNFDYLRLRKKLEALEGQAFWRAYYLNALQPEGDRNDGMHRFHSWLQSAPPTGPKIITKLYNLRDSDASHAYCRACGSTVQLTCPVAPGYADDGHQLTRRSQKGVDVGIASLALTHVDSYDVLTLSSGDGDLLDAVKYVSDLGKEIELAVFRSGVATELQSWADRIFWIDDFADEVSR